MSAGTAQTLPLTCCGAPACPTPHKLLLGKEVVLGCPELNKVSAETVLRLVDSSILTQAPAIFLPLVGLPVRLSTWLSWPKLWPSPCLPWPPSQDIQSSKGLKELGLGSVLL